MTQQKTNAAKTIQTGAKASPSSKTSAASRVLSRAAAAPKKTGAAPVAAEAEPIVAAEPAVAAKLEPTVAAASKAPAPVTAPKPAPVAAKPVQPAARPAQLVAAKPVQPVATKPSQPVAAKPQGKAGAQRNGFRTGEFVVYPAHGVGQIVAIEEQEVAGFKLELFVVSFMKDKMTLRVPTSKVTSVGLRKLAEADVMQRALDTLMGRARIKRTMWSRRAQEYEAKINSGDLVAIAEVVRDLYRSDAQPEQSYSERQLYEAALDRMAREIAAVQKLTESESLKLIDTQLQRGPRRGPKTDADADAAGDVDGDADGDIEEAA